jgi:hypothetical protein
MAAAPDRQFSIDNDTTSRTKTTVGYALGSPHMSGLAVYQSPTNARARVK